ncbi:MAG: response regulator transcription factor [Bdellovibrionales bacterium]|nr:response regulator transcription factor [Bdellovibrionales bacterium]
MQQSAVAMKHVGRSAVREKVLVIEDEADILELMRYNLQKEGYEVIGVNSGEEGLRVAQRERPDLVVLDLMLPGMDGLEVCQILKSGAGTQKTPIIMISAKGEESDIISGLELGADDYITKPFSPKILIARTKAVLRRLEEAPTDDRSTVSVHELNIDPGRFQVLLAGREIQLTLTEFRILHFLARHPGWVFTRYQIVDAVKGEDYAVTDRAVDVQIVGLRKKLGEFGTYIETVRGVGYRFKE